MKTKTGFELHDICGEKVIIASGIENLDFSKMISLNETAAYLWNAVAGKDFDHNMLVRLLCKEYEVSEAQASRDVEQLVSEWKEMGIIED